MSTKPGLLLCAILLLPVSSVTGYSGDLSCDELEEKVAETDKNTEILYPPPLTGKWVSERCEVRAGPLYMLRTSTFAGNESFVMTQYHFSDGACSRPLYSVTARGRYTLRGRSWLTPGATQADYALSRVSVTPYTPQMAEELAGRVNSSCVTGATRRRWRAHREYLVLSLPDIHQRQLTIASSPTHIKRSLAPGLGGNAAQMSPEDTACLSAVSAGFHEVGLVRVQGRPPGPPDLARPRTELLLAQVHNPTAFQPPLLRSDQAEWCEVCRAVGRGTERDPPELSPAPEMAPTLGGEWLSARCETRPLGLFLRRRLRVSGSSWHAEYRFYSDPSCQTGTLTAAAEGYLRPAKVPSSKVDGATDFDFMVERAFLTLYDPGLVQSLQDDRRCGPPGIWQVGVTRDVTPSQGCAPLGITVPSVEYELVRVESDPVTGHTILLLGHTDNPKKAATKHRPTAFQPPLLQCNGPELPPLSHLLNGYSLAARPLPTALLVPFVVTPLLAALF